MKKLPQKTAEIPNRPRSEEREQPVQSEVVKNIDHGPNASGKAFFTQVIQ